MTRRVYRARAFYSIGTPRENVIVRHFHTKRARDQWAQRRRDGYDEVVPGSFLDDGRPAIPAADRVDVADSLPVLFPNDGEDGS